MFKLSSDSLFRSPIWEESRMFQSEGTSERNIHHLTGKGHDPALYRLCKLWAIEPRDIILLLLI